MEAQWMSYSLHLSGFYNNIVNVLIVTDESQRTPYGEEMDEKSSSIFSLSCNLNCKFVNLIRSLMFYTKITLMKL